MSGRRQATAAAPVEAMAAMSWGLSRVPAATARSPAFRSSPALRTLAPRRTPGGTLIRSPSTATSSCMTQVSAPSGIMAPVKMRAASPAPMPCAAGAPARDRTVTLSVVFPAPSEAWARA